MNFIRIAAVSAVALSLGACASLSPQECATADWQAIGFEDGARGRTPEQGARHREACAKVGISMDFQDYRVGHAEGVAAYCRPETGFALGKRGGNYNGVCAGPAEAEFVAAWEDGRVYHSLVQAVRETEQDLDQTERELEETRDELSVSESELVADGLNSEERRRLLDDTRKLAKRVGELEARIEDLIFELGVRRERLDGHRVANGI